MKICLHVQSFLIMWSILTSHLCTHNSLPGTKRPQERNWSFQMYNCINLQTCKTGTFENALYHHVSLRCSCWITTSEVASSWRHNEQQGKKSKHKVVSAIMPYHKHMSSSQTSFPSASALSLSLCVENNHGQVNAAFHSHTPLRWRACLYLLFQAPRSLLCKRAKCFN